MADEINEIKAKGGFARAEALTPQQRSDIAKKAAEARWNGPPLKGTHQGELKLGNSLLPCYVLEDGTRVVVRAGFIKAMGRTGKAKGGRLYDNEFQTPVFLSAENLKPFISEDLIGNSKPIVFSFNGTKRIGYKAEFLPQVCEVFIDAKDAGALRPNQEHIAQACKMLYRAFAKVGIVALVDEVTGYQDVRHKEALQALLDKYLRKEFAAWAKRFPDDFYKEIFRLRNWPWPRVNARRPQVVALYTKDIVYERLAPGILKELEARNPIDEKGNRRARHHQWLTEDLGCPALAQHLHAVTAFMRAATDWESFKKSLDRAFPKRGDTLTFEFMNEPSGT
jgi:P63C domain